MTTVRNEYWPGRTSVLRLLVPFQVWSTLPAPLTRLTPNDFTTRPFRTMDARASAASLSRWVTRVNRARFMLNGFGVAVRPVTRGAARSIVRGLLTFGRQMPLERRHVLLDELIDKVLTLTAADLRIESVKVDRDMEPGLPPVWADGNQLQQVLVNLVTNAKQAMAEQPEGQRRLRVTTSCR